MVQIVEFWDGRKIDCSSKLPFFKELEREFLELEVTSVDFFTEEGGEMAEFFKITAIPTIIVMKDGIEVERINLRRSKKYFKELVQKWS